MNIKVDFAKWFDERRVTVHLFPSILIDYMTIREQKTVTILISWLFWSIGVTMKNDG